MNASGALECLLTWERLTLATLPTPLFSTPRLAAELSDPPIDLYVKMDAETGFALGGNKVRKLEYELAPTRLEGISRLLTAGGPQSNHCRVTAAAAARATNGSSDRLYSSANGSPAGAGVRRLVGMWVCSGR